MAGILPRNYIIGIIIFTLCIVGGVSIIATLQAGSPENFDSDKFDEFNTTFNTLGDITTQVNSLEDTISGTDPNPGVFGVLNSLISSAWQSLKLLFTSFGFMDTALGGMTTIFGVPTWIVGLVVLLITVILIFAIFSAIFQRDI